MRAPTLPWEVPTTWLPAPALQHPTPPHFRAHALQPGKCLYTTIRELVENGLDAAECIDQLPDLTITV